MSRSIVRTAAAVATAAALAGAPAALARPADQGARLPAAVQLTPAQIRALHGHIPPEPFDYYVAPAPVSASHHTQSGGSTTPVPWIAGGAAALLFALFGLVRFGGVRPHRRRQPAA
jgi:hypothetical protein